MNITKTQESSISETALPRPSNGELQNEYNYILAEQLTKNLLDRSLISIDEYDKIMDKNRKSFSPFIAKIIP